MLSIKKKNDAVLDATGGRFNIFQTLGVNHYENKHSLILAALLNPGGTHGLKDEFLNLFVNEKWICFSLINFILHSG